MNANKTGQYFRYSKEGRHAKCSSSGKSGKVKCRFSNNYPRKVQRSFYYHILKVPLASHTYIEYPYNVLPNITLVDISRLISVWSTTLKVIR